MTTIIYSNRKLYTDTRRIQLGVHGWEDLLLPKAYVVRNEDRKVIALFAKSGKEPKGSSKLLFRELCLALFKTFENREKDSVNGISDVLKKITEKGHGDTETIIVLPSRAILMTYQDIENIKVIERSDHSVYAIGSGAIAARTLSVVHHVEPDNMMHEIAKADEYTSGTTLTIDCDQVFIDEFNKKRVRSKAKCS